MKQGFPENVVMPEGDTEITRLRLVSDPVSVISELRILARDEMTKKFRHENQEMTHFVDQVYEQVVEMMIRNAEQLPVGIHIANQDIQLLLECLQDEDDKTPEANRILRRLFLASGFTEEDLNKSSHINKYT